jgi:hypothetical protein
MMGEDVQVINGKEKMLLHVKVSMLSGEVIYTKPSENRCDPPDCTYISRQYKKMFIF